MAWEIWKMCRTGVVDPVRLQDAPLGAAQDSWDVVPCTVVLTICIFCIRRFVALQLLWFRAHGSLPPILGPGTQSLSMRHTAPLRLRTTDDLSAWEGSCHSMTAAGTPGKLNTDQVSMSTASSVLRVVVQHAMCKPSQLNINTATVRARNKIHCVAPFYDTKRVRHNQWL